MSEEERILLHVCDWNYRDKYYEMPNSILLEFGKKALKNGSEAWDWLTPQVNYGENPELPVRRCDDSANHTLDTYFWDYQNSNESVRDWDIDALGTDLPSGVFHMRRPTD